MVRKYHDKVEKNTLKILKKLFHFSTIQEAINSENEIQMSLEKKYHKEIDLIKIDELKGDPCSLYDYSKYRTLNSILDIYVDNKISKSKTDRWMEEMENGRR